MILLEVPEGVSRVHASRRLFNFLKVACPPPLQIRGSNATLWTRRRGAGLRDGDGGRRRASTRP